MPSRQTKSSRPRFASTATTASGCTPCASSPDATRLDRRCRSAYVAERPSAIAPTASGVRSACLQKRSTKVSMLMVAGGVPPHERAVQQRWLQRPSSRPAPVACPVASTRIIGVPRLPAPHEVQDEGFPLQILELLVRVDAVLEAIVGTLGERVR